MKYVWIVCGMAIGIPAIGADVWPQFRGPEGRAIATDRGLPEKFGPNENIRWKADLPGRGLSCPVVASGKIFLTANSGMAQNRLHVLALDLASGKELWQRQFWTTGQTLCHEKTCMACPTIVTDGAMVFALFATGDLIALTVDGDVRWMRSFSIEYPKMINHVGRSSSPLLAGGVLAVLMENQGESYLFGIDPVNGQDKWKATRPLQNNWNTPLVIQRNGGTEIVISSYDDITAYDAATGKVRWTSVAEKFNPITSPIVAGDLVLAAGMRGLVAVRPNDEKPDIVWKVPQLRADTPSPIVVGNRVFTVGQNVMKCADTVTGKIEWDLRIPGPCSASPIFADGKLYLSGEDGKVTVVVPDKEPKIVATNELNETILATPAVANGMILFRSDKHLWCFAGGGRIS